tara:strand:+ start:3470 stop:3655 length:186 start_codon:yes stop_codon:yes gene_type:complete
MAEHYGMLPTQLLREASTVDLVIFDTALSWKNYQQQKQKGGVPKNSVSQNDLQRRMDKVKQ